MPSARMTALLGLLAVAGYQNRHRLAEMFGQATGQNRPGGDPAAQPGAGGSQAGAGGLGGLLGGLLGGGAGGAAASGGGMTGGLQDLIEQFTGKGQADVAKSWVSTGPNQEIETGQLEEALGQVTIDSLTQQTGLSREELLSRLQAVLPTAVDKLTPEGRLPTGL